MQSASTRIPLQSKHAIFRASFLPSASAAIQHACPPNSWLYPVPEAIAILSMHCPFLACHVCQENARLPAAMSACLSTQELLHLAPEAVTVLGDRCQL